MFQLSLALGVPAAVVRHGILYRYKRYLQVRYLQLLICAAATFSRPCHLHRMQHPCNPVGRLGGRAGPRRQLGTTAAASNDSAITVSSKSYDVPVTIANKDVETLLHQVNVVFPNLRTDVVSRPSRLWMTNVL